MEISHIQSGDPRGRTSNEEEKQKWAEEHARRLQRRFEQWQKPLGIDGEEYHRFLTEQLRDSYNEPLRKSLIESIS
ncbi:MAG TPA: hypothetical protein VMX13_06820 [Sedimentisphaerales bacterium]|nr:hypothetical protein [Sedimentisphaerales bacterium]